MRAMTGSRPWCAGVRQMVDLVAGANEAGDCLLCGRCWRIKGLSWGLVGFLKLPLKPALEWGKAG